jgi:P27 family predicted phage terminase small subunit
MGLRGPAPKPSALEAGEGNPGKRRINKLEPKPSETRPRMPSTLDAGAKKEWRRLLPILERMRVLTEADGIALANLCYDYSLLQQAQASLVKTGMLTMNKKTEMIHQNPLIKVVAQTTDRISRGLQQFGLTPASRSRIQTVSDPKGEDDLAALLRAPVESAKPLVQ